MGMKKSGYRGSKYRTGTTDSAVAEASPLLSTLLQISGTVAERNRSFKILISQEKEEKYLKTGQCSTSVF